MKFCNQCGAELVDNARFCGGCGRPLVQQVVHNTVCPRCHTTLAEKKNFCPCCGQDLRAIFNQSVVASMPVSAPVSISPAPAPKPIVAPVPEPTPIPTPVIMANNNIATLPKSSPQEKRKPRLLWVKKYWQKCTSWPKKTWAIIAGSGLLLFLLIAIALTSYLCNGLSNWRLLPAVLLSAAHNGFSDRLQPVDLPLSGSAKIKIDNIKGVELYAASNALDKPQTIKMQEVSDTDRDAMIKQQKYLQQGKVWKMLRIDAGSEKTTRFVQPVELTFDLKTLKIPRELWKYMRVVHIYDDGSSEYMAGELDGSDLKIGLRNNEVVVLMAALGCVSIYAYEKDWKEAPKDCRTSYEFEAFPDFIIHPADSDKPADEQGARAAFDKLQELRVKYGIFRQTPPPWYGAVIMAPQTTTYVSDDAMIQLVADKEYQALMDSTWNNQTWLLDHFLSANSKQILLAVQKSWKYLVDERKFRAPTHKLHIFLTNEKIGVSAKMSNPYSAPPFMVFSLRDARPENIPVNAVHELFHVVQNGYYWVSSNDYLWFEEALAVTVEQEAKKAWQLSAWEDTVRDYSGFLEPLDLPAEWFPNNTQPYIDHGYSMSYFVEYLRDRYYRVSSGTFVPLLLEDFSRNLPRIRDWKYVGRGGTLASLWNTTSNSSQKFCDDYSDFSLNNAAKIADAADKKRKIVMLKASNLVYEYGPPDKSLPLANEVAYVVVDQSLINDPDVQMVVKNYNKVNGDYRLAVSWFGAPFQAVAAEDNQKVAGKENRRAIIMRTHAYTSSASETAQTAIFLLVKPADKPQLAIVGEDLQITIPATALMKHSLHLCEQAELEIVSNCEGSEQKINKKIAVNASGATLRIPLKELRPEAWWQFWRDEKANMTINVRWREIAATTSNISGPYSDKSVINSNVLQQILPGNWQGKLTITGSSVSSIAGFIAQVMPSESSSPPMGYGYPGNDRNGLLEWVKTYPSLKGLQVPIKINIVMDKNGKFSAVFTSPGKKIDSIRGLYPEGITLPLTIETKGGEVTLVGRWGDLPTSYLPGVVADKLSIRQKFVVKMTADQKLQGKFTIDFFVVSNVIEADVDLSKSN